MCNWAVPSLMLHPLNRVHNLHVNCWEFLIFGWDWTALVAHFIPSFRHKVTLKAVPNRNMHQLYWGEQMEGKKFSKTGPRNENWPSTYSEMWTKTLSPPSVGSMNPWPFSLQKDRTTPRWVGPILALSDLQRGRNHSNHACSTQPLLGIMIIRSLWQGPQCIMIHLKCFMIPEANCDHAHQANGLTRESFRGQRASTGINRIQLAMNGLCHGTAAIFGHAQSYKLCWDRGEALVKRDFRGNIASLERGVMCFNMSDITV